MTRKPQMFAGSAAMTEDGATATDERAVIFTGSAAAFSERAVTADGFVLLPHTYGLPITR